ncbi:hypothetical protein FS749_014529, partial [Ceratobasidium sp. UAMH 11750]
GSHSGLTEASRTTLCLAVHPLSTPSLLQPLVIGVTPPDVFLGDYLAPTVLHTRHTRGQRNKVNYSLKLQMPCCNRYWL